MTMDVEAEPEIADHPIEHPNNIDQRDILVDFLIENEEICFKSQQRGEADLTKEEKKQIAVKILEENRVTFLTRFGPHLRVSDLEYFKQFTSDLYADSYEVNIVLNDLIENSRIVHNHQVKNRRYEALKEMISEDSYFSEIEMMKRNPLLYEQLVGQYLTVEEIKERDKYQISEGTTFVKILMESIERGDAELKRKEEIKQEDKAEEKSEDEDDEKMVTSDYDRSRSPSPVASTSLWGEIGNKKTSRCSNTKRKKQTANYGITASEQKLLKEEFITSMYQSFLDGTDEDFDYKTVDSNPKYDNTETIEQDIEEKYFDTEEPAIAKKDDIDMSSEDELDIYMSALNDNPSVQQLSKDLERINKD